MELGCIGFLLGAITSIIFVGIGVCFGRNHKAECDDDSDIRIYKPSSDRDHRSVVRHTPEEIECVVNELKRSACTFEKEVLDDMWDRIKTSADEQHIKDLAQESGVKLGG